MRRAGLLLLLVLFGSVAAADDDKPVEKRRPLTPEQAADKVLEAFEARDEATLEALAEEDEPDPWLVADELCYRGQHDAAQAFAQAAPRVDVERLPAYILAWRKRRPDESERELLATVQAAMQARMPQKVVEGTASLAEDLGSVVRIRLGHARGIALGVVRRLAESHDALGRAADAARELGWLGRAAALFNQAGSSAWQGSDWKAARRGWEACLAIAERRGDRQGVATTLNSIGAAHQRQGDYAKALSCYERALELSQALGDRHGVATTLGNIGRVHRNLVDYAMALSFHERALEQKQALGDRQGVADTLGNIGAVQYRLGDYAKALSFNERALEEMEALGDRQGVAAMLGNIGNAHLSLGDYAQALSFHERALEQKQVLGDRQGMAGTLGSIGIIHQKLGDYAKALSCYEGVLEQMEALGDRQGAATALGNMGIVHYRLGDYAKALSIHERALGQMQVLGDKRGAAGTLGNIGIVHQSLGDYAKALSCYERALEQKQALGNRKGVTNTLGDIGTLHCRLGDYAKALSCYERALEQKQALGDRQGAATALGNIGTVHYRLGDYAKALSYCERALQRSQALGDRQGAATALGHIGIVHQSLGDYARALSCCERALEQMEALGDRQGAATALGNIGTVHYRLGDYAKALSCCECALERSQALGDGPGVARTLGNIGTVHGSLGDYAKALSFNERALERKQALGDRQGVADTLGTIGVVHGRLGDHAKARRFLKRSASAARNLRATSTLVFALQQLARLHLEAGRPSRALGRAREALNAVEGLLGGLGEEQGAMAREQHAGLFALGTLAAVRLEEPEEALTFLESGRAGALLESLGGRQALRWTDLPEHLRTAEAKAQAAEARARHEYDRAHQGKNLRETRRKAKLLDEALERVREVSARIQREAKRQAGLFYPRAATLEEIEGWLEAGEVLVLYALCLDEALALVLTHDGERIVSLGQAADVAAAYEALASEDRQGDVEPLLEQLRERLVVPLDLPASASVVLVSPEGPLCYLPWGALFQDRVVACTPSGTTHVLLKKEEREPGTQVLALGDPDYALDPDPLARDVYARRLRFEPLPGTRAEAQAIGDVVLLGADANEMKFREALGQQKRWGAVHLACHGLIDPERPTLSSLAVTRSGDGDGFLTALEVLRMEIPADLATLSACETGTGKIVNGEGIVGLTRAFMFAGAPRVICSLWKVDDEATRALMVKFYELWRPKEGKGLGVAAALEKAQDFVRSHEEWRHPYFWAAWVLWGLPD